MSAAKKGLGRGFESLIPTDLIDDSFDPNSAYDPTAKQDERVSKEATLPIDKLFANPDQPRRVFDADGLEELSGSIKEHGIIQPIVVTPKGEGYEIVAGERRYRASKLAGLTEVPVIVRSMSDQTQLEVSLIENIQRRDLSSIETATAYAKLRDQFNLSNDEIAARVHKSPSAVINKMRLLKLPSEVIALIAERQLSEGQARPLIGQDRDFIVSIVPRIVTEEWSARKVEQYIVSLKDKAATKSGSKTPVVESKYEASLEVLRSRLNTGVDLRVNAKGAGKLTISFKNEEDLERIKALLG